MVWSWQKKVVFPVKRAWVAVAGRVRSRKDGSGILKLHNDVQTCGYEDVQVMWEMLRSGLEPSRISRQRRWPFWRPQG
ncbi:uncharacterized protein LOC109720655 [Ananas comosus]|uniref:Uncharacterized protein LOC109720655 n=1 Tax=Ananas comosus TaxID=4615 RepID=A0A6P5G5B8_ANACO|nr:uncharacterized protein LOC109720655 [Ananas comosus]